MSDVHLENVVESALTPQDYLDQEVYLKPNNRLWSSDRLILSQNPYENIGRVRSITQTGMLEVMIPKPGLARLSGNYTPYELHMSEVILKPHN